jgi:hypothetical protein
LALGALAAGGCGGSLAPGSVGDASADSGTGLRDSAMGVSLYPDSSGLGQDAAACVARQLMGEPGCASCVEAACAATLSLAESSCAALLSCECACTTGVSSCSDSCATMVDSACMGAALALSGCEQQKCAMECGTGVSPTGNPPDSGGTQGLTGLCLELSMCCMALPADEQSACEHIASLDNQSACSAGLSVFTEGGLCK